MEDKPILVKTGIPGWLQPEKKDRGLLHTEATLEKALSLIASGQTLTNICRDNPDMPDERFLRPWLLSDPERRDKYYKAKAVGADVLEDQQLAIADGFDTPEDVQRSQLRIATRWRLMSVWDPDRYREKVDAAVNVNIDLGKAMEAGMARVEASRNSVTIEGEKEK